MTRLYVLAAMPGGTSVSRVDVATGEKLPVPTQLDGDGAFDEALGRRGWVAAKVEYKIGAFVDGEKLGSPRLLPEAWQMWPAAASELVLLRRYLGRSDKPGERQTVAVVGPDARVHRSMVLPWGSDEGKIAGEIEAGVVTWEGISSWNGEASPLPVAITGDGLTDPRPFAVLAGRVILFEGTDYIEAVDTLSRRVRRLRIPSVPRRWPSSSRFGSLPRYNAEGTWVKAADKLGAVVAGVHGDLRWLPFDHEGSEWRSAVWFGERLLIFDYRSRPRDDCDDSRISLSPTWYDPLEDRLSPATVASPDYMPRVDVTGRFAVLSP